MDPQLPPPPPPPQSYMRPPLPPPPPPSMADPNQRPPPNPWYSTQFQYQHHSPSPPTAHPPQQQQQWPPPSYPAPHPHYPAHHYPPPPPPPPYHQVNQDWGNANWTHRQNLEYQVHNHEEDWAAKAKAWAAAKAGNDQLQPQPQAPYPPSGRPEEQSHYHDQYAQSSEYHYPNMQTSTLPPSSYQQHLAPGAPQQQTPYGYPAGDSATAFPQRENSSINPSVHQPEVPSSYSSVTGKEVAGETGMSYMSSSLPVAPAQQYHAQPPLPAGSRSFSMEEPQYTFGVQSSEPAATLSDQPLDFVPRFNHDYDSHVQSTYSVSGGPVRGVNTIGSVSNYNWAPPGGYPPMPQALPPASQVDPSMTLPPSFPGHSANMFGRLPGHEFHPSASIDTPFSGAGASLHAAAAFPGDAFGVSGVSERPKKASVPNWLREEIIKTKAVITSSAPDFSRDDDNQSIEDENRDRSYGNGGQADGKSIRSSWSMEEEDDDEDDVEAAKTAAINQEIKRVLTEVLLKVTDELFDEIATKILDEDNFTEEDISIVARNNKLSTDARAATTATAEAKVLIPAKVVEDDYADDNEKSTSSSPGDLLGLASYASDDDDGNGVESSAQPNSKENANYLESTSSKNSTGKNLDDDNGIKSSAQPNSKENANYMESTSSRNSTGKNLTENGQETNEHRDKSTKLKIDSGRMRPDVAKVDHRHVATQPSADMPAQELVQGDELHSSRIKSVVEEKEMLGGLVTSTSKEIKVEKAVVKTETPREPKILTVDHSESRKNRSNDRSDRHETKSSEEKYYVKEEKSRKDELDEKGNGTHRRHDEKHVKKERLDDQKGSKDKAKEKGVKSEDKAKDSDSRKRSFPSDDKESKRETERERKAGKDDARKKERTKDNKKDKSRHKNSSDSHRHKRSRRSLSNDSRGRDSKDSPVLGHTNDSNDESSDDLRRKRHSRRHESPSPVRSKRRQVSRSPHSKHSQRRDPPYSSLDSKRGKSSRSRSRSPVRRRR